MRFIKVFDADKNKAFCMINIKQIAALETVFNDDQIKGLNVFLNSGKIIFLELNSYSEILKIYNSVNDFYI